ncbi:uncharacterized protein BO88DRAFT_222431 [Aspergillus vadensis CBS 113365]|uniref:Uncharacterized protein n=1 Tax=Aspergillus vadensis (strain CBS 113365 / IMI 142717 / IBT 24658) TaxID=1448311 RepID=A0A319B9R4_ASPVC|nr:hypothetical protein BO88DRAFT_222431 [Aspergillus vadensis CBS 113365]PYH63243.1 hypothetical protein BO88DRAFT_222431 [Aspergillus vadensis CBS 113365]
MQLSSTRTKFCYLLDFLHRIIISAAIRKRSRPMRGRKNIPAPFLLSSPPSLGFMWPLRNHPSCLRAAFLRIVWNCMCLIPIYLSLLSLPFSSDRKTYTLAFHLGPFPDR